MSRMPPAISSLGAADPAVDDPIMWSTVLGIDGAGWLELPGRMFSESWSTIPKPGGGASLGSEIVPVTVMTIGPLSMRVMLEANTPPKPGVGILTRKSRFTLSSKPTVPEDEI